MAIERRRKDDVSVDHGLPGHHAGHDLTTPPRWVGMCGEMAGSPIEAMVLIALGFRTLSLTATAVGPVKAMTQSLDASAFGSSC